jgi:hypothetical protein
MLGVAIFGLAARVGCVRKYVLLLVDPLLGDDRERNQLYCI